MNIEKEIINNFNELLFGVYKSEKLTCLGDNDYIVNGRNVLNVDDGALE